MKTVSVGPNILLVSVKISAKDLYLYITYL